MWGYVVLFAGTSIFLIDLYFVCISFGFRKTQCGKCKGYLTNIVQQRDVYVGVKSGRFYKHYLDYVYVYRISGKEYRISGGVPGMKSNVRQVVDITYQKKNPKFAYIDRLTFPIQPIVALTLCPLWVMLIVFGFLLI